MEWEGEAWDAITLDEKQYETLVEKKWDVFCFGTLAQRSEENRKTLKRLLAEINADHLFYDVNLRAGFYIKECILSSLEHCTILKINEEETTVVSNFVFGTVYSCETLYRLLVEKYLEFSFLCISKGQEELLFIIKESMTKSKPIPSKWKIR